MLRSRLEFSENNLESYYSVVVEHFSKLQREIKKTSICRNLRERFSAVRDLRGCQKVRSGWQTSVRFVEGRTV